MNILILSKNPYGYKNGYYHSDWLDELKSLHNCYVWGKGFKDYFKNAKISQLINVAKKKLNSIDLICVSSTWDAGEIYDQSSECSGYDPEPTIKLSETEIPKVYFLNKEYKNLKEKNEYINNSKIDLVVSVISEVEQKLDMKANFLHLPFAISEKRIFSKFKEIIKKYDFGFTGALHKNYLDERYIVKKNIFGEDEFKSFIGKKNINNKIYKIYWAEWGAKNFLTRRSLLPSGKAYFKFLSQCNSFLCTPSADGIIGTRFYELMASETICLCPEETLNYKSGRDICVDKKTCLLYGENTRSFLDALYITKNDKSLIKKIKINAKNKILNNHTYNSRILKLTNYLNNNILKKC